MNNNTQIRVLKNYYNTVKKYRNNRISRGTFKNNNNNKNNESFLTNFSKTLFEAVPQNIDIDILPQLIQNLKDILAFLKEKSKKIDSIIKYKNIDKEEDLDLFAELKQLLDAGNILKSQLHKSLMLNISNKENELYKKFESIYITIESYKSYFEKKYNQLFPIILDPKNNGNNTFKKSNSHYFRRRKAYYTGKQDYKKNNNITNENIIKDIYFKLTQIINKITDILISLEKYKIPKISKSTKKRNKIKTKGILFALQKMVNNRQDKIKKQFEDLKTQIDCIKLENTDKTYTFDITPYQQSKAISILSSYMIQKPKERDLRTSFVNTISLISELHNYNKKGIELESHEAVVIALLRILGKINNRLMESSSNEICFLVLQKLESINLIDRYHLKSYILDYLLSFCKTLSEQKCTKDIIININFINSLFIKLHNEIKQKIKENNKQEEGDLYITYISDKDKLKSICDFLRDMIEKNINEYLCINEPLKAHSVYSSSQSVHSGKYGFSESRTVESEA